MKFENDILKLLQYRSPGKTICPSEVLPQEDKKNKKLMESVRDAAKSLVEKNQIEILQKGAVIDPTNIRGPIRLRLKEKK